MKACCRHVAPVAHAPRAAFSKLLLEVFRLNGALLAAGDRLDAPHGLSSAHWQVLGAIAAGPATGRAIGRAMGLTRQGVQRTVDPCAARGWSSRSTIPATAVPGWCGSRSWARAGSTRSAGARRPGRTRWPEASPPTSSWPRAGWPAACARGSWPEPRRAPRRERCVRTIPRLPQLPALAVFPGGIPAHRVPGAVADPAAGWARFVALHEAKHPLTAGLTLAALAATLRSGALLLLTRCEPFARRRLRAKLALVLLVTLDDGLVPIPAAAEMAGLAAAAAERGVLDPRFAELEARERLAGPINLVALGLILVLAPARPRLLLLVSGTWLLVQGPGRGFLETPWLVGMVGLFAS